MTSIEWRAAINENIANEATTYLDTFSPGTLTGFVFKISRIGINPTKKDNKMEAGIAAIAPTTFHGPGRSKTKRTAIPNLKNISAELFIPSCLNLKVPCKMPQTIGKINAKIRAKERWLAWNRS